MRIAINMLYMLPGVVGGTETYAACLVHSLNNLKLNDEFIVFMNYESGNWPFPSASNFTRVVCPVKATNRAKRYLYEQFLLPQMLKKYKVDIVHSLGYVGPLFVFCPHIVTIHDLNFIGHKKNMLLVKRIILDFFVKNSAYRANHIIAASEFSKKEIKKYLNIASKNITVIHEAAEQRENPDQNNCWNAIETRYKIQKPYVLAFSSQSHHKNIPRLIKSFAKIVPILPHNLVLVGHLSDEIVRGNILNNKDLTGRIFVTGYVPRKFVSALLANAELFVFPSLYEGFGLPILEAQQLGVCVAASRIAALPEVAGDGATWFDPYSPDSISEAIITCLQNNNLREVLIQKGYKNISRFSWESTALQTVNIYRNLLLEK